MKRVKKSNKSRIRKHLRIPGWIYWLPRIFSIIFLLFLVMFSLDVFGNNYTFWETVLGLFMHNIPVFVLTILLIIAWKREWVGALTFILVGLLYMGLTIFRVMNSELPLYLSLSWSLIIAVPAFAVGILFWINWKLKRKSKKKNSKKSKRK